MLIAQVFYYCFSAVFLIIIYLLFANLQVLQNCYSGCHLKGLIAEAGDTQKASERVRSQK